MDVVVPPESETERTGKKGKYLDLARELKKLWNVKVTVIPIVIGAFGTVIKRLIKGLEVEMSASEDHPKDSIVKIGQYTMKNPGDLRGPVDTQTPVENRQLMLVVINKHVFYLCYLHNFSYSYYYYYYCLCKGSTC